MRHFITSLAAGLVFIAACAGETVLRAPPPPVNWQSFDVHVLAPDGATDRARIADAYLQALASPGFLKLGTLLDETVHFSFAGASDVLGRQAVLMEHDALLGAFASRSFVIRRVIFGDDTQAVEWTMTAVHPAIREAVLLKGVALLSTLAGGAISDVRLYFDQALLAAQIGAGPKLPLPRAEAGPRQEVGPSPGVPDRGVAAMRAALDALENDDQAAYLAAMTDDVELNTLRGLEPARGKSAARAEFQTLRKGLRRLDTQIDNAWAVGSFAVVEYHLTGEQRGPIGGVPVRSDAFVTLCRVDVVETREGKIARIWRYENPAQLLSTHREAPMTRSRLSTGTPRRTPRTTGDGR